MRKAVRSLAVLISLVASAFAFVPSAAAAGTSVTVTNGNAPGWIPFDASANSVDAHDGEIKAFGARYYLYRTSYVCRYALMHRFHPDTRPLTPLCGLVSSSST